MEVNIDPCSLAIRGQVTDSRDFHVSRALMEENLLNLSSTPKATQPFSHRGQVDGQSRGEGRML